MSRKQIPRTRWAVRGGVRTSHSLSALPAAPRPQGPGEPGPAAGAAFGGLTLSVRVSIFFFFFNSFTEIQSTCPSAHILERTCHWLWSVPRVVDSKHHSHGLDIFRRFVTPKKPVSSGVTPITPAPGPEATPVLPVSVDLTARDILYKCPFMSGFFQHHAFKVPLLQDASTVHLFVYG